MAPLSSSSPATPARHQVTTGLLGNRGLKMPVTVFPRADLSQLPSTCANGAPAPRFSLMETMLMALYLLTSKSVMEETTRATMDPFLKSDTSSRRASGRPFRACCRRRRCQHRR